MELIRTFLYMLNQMSPYILLGFLIAGILYSFVPSRIMSRHLSGTGWRSVVKAALFGVPLPLCSCGVLPTAVSMRRNGASRAASSSFLIATPQTGVDSIAATWSMLGPAMAVVRPVAALVTAVAGGCAVGAAEREADECVDATCPIDEVSPRRGLVKKAKDALVYGFYNMVQSIGKWLVIGLVIATLITVFVPESVFVSLNRYPLVAMLAVVAVSVPMYVCATGSIPIAMSLMLKGLSPGTALVLLMAGPAANFASIAVVGKTMGRRNAMIYLASIIVGAVAFGLMVDYLLPRDWFVLPLAGGHKVMCHQEFSLFDTACSALLVMLLAVAFLLPILKKKPIKITEMTKEYHIKGMSCPHCKMTVEKNLSAIPGVKSVSVDLANGTATVDGEHDPEAVARRVNDIGFEFVR